MGLFGWLAYGLGRSVVHSTLDERPAGSNQPVRQGTEADFKRDEQRFAEDEQRLSKVMNGDTDDETNE